MEIEKYNIFLEKNIYNNYGKYEVVIFEKNTRLDNIITGENITHTLNVSKNSKCKLFFNDKKEIIGIRPMKETDFKEVNIKKTKSLTLSNIWDANFLFEKPIKFNLNKPPFKVEKYI